VSGTLAADSVRNPCHRVSRHLHITKQFAMGTLDVLGDLVSEMDVERVLTARKALSIMLGERIYAKAAGIH
jgi:hypothetical protein